MAMAFIGLFVSFTLGNAAYHQPSEISVRLRDCSYAKCIT